MSEHDEYLMHYGVKGMKWHIRKDKNKDPRSRNTNSSTKRGSRPTAGKQSSGIGEIWALGKAVVDAMLGGDSGDI